MKTRTFNPDRFTRRNLRLPEHDYRWTGAYFVTLRAQQHEPVFDIPELRNIVVDTWQALPRRFPGVTLDEFVVMPDHVHFINWLDGTVEHAPALGSVVGAYKSITTVEWLRYIKENEMTWPGRLWQQNYYERVIRDAPELEQKRKYIHENPMRAKKSGNQQE